MTSEEKRRRRRSARPGRFSALKGPSAVEGLVQSGRDGVQEGLRRCRGLQVFPLPLGSTANIDSRVSQQLFVSTFSGFLAAEE